MKQLLYLLVIILVAAPAVAEPELKGNPSELSQYLDNIPKTVRLNESSELKMPADRAIISLRVVTENKSLQEALRLNQELRAKIQAALKEKGLPADRVQPSKFSSTPKYGFFGDKAKSYRVENVIKITAQDEAEFQAVAKLVDTMTEVRYDSIQFERLDKDELKTKALIQAIDKVNAKKQIYEEKLGLKLTARNFTEGEVQIVPNSPPIVGYGMSAGAADIALSKAPAVADSPAEEMLTSFAELVFKAEVSVEYSVTAK